MSDQQYDNTNRGALFKNDKEGGNPKWPDYRGNLNVNGLEFWIDAWISKSKKGATYMSLKVKPKVDKGERTTQDQAIANGPGAAKDFDDDIPF